MQNKLPLLALFAWTLKLISCMQSNNTCAPIPKDKRQLVCQCTKQLQLICMFNIDIKEIPPANLDKSLTPVYYGDVALSRAAVNPDQEYRDINYNFEKNFYKNKNNNKVYLYFPNFAILDSPYIRVTLLRFLYIPSFAFYDKTALVEKKQSLRSIGSVVFELGEVYDFGIDRLAFFGLKTDFLIIEGRILRLKFQILDSQTKNISCIIWTTVQQYILSQSFWGSVIYTCYFNRKFGQSKILF